MLGSQATSSISGWRYWARHFHIMDIEAAAYWPERGNIFGTGINFSGLKSFLASLFLLLGGTFCLGFAIWFIANLIEGIRNFLQKGIRRYFKNDGVHKKPRS
jgi:hypothetical protein